MAKLHRNSHWLVKNLNGTTDNKCECASWIAHWRNCTGSDRVLCCVVPCGRLAQVGAHVIVIDRRSDRSWWIVPMCKKHNNTHNQEPMYIKRDIEMVSANVYRTCHQGDWSWTVP
ncbi:hypothetical protein GCM10011611_54570 [Aliidongia dinghuensis]|uniref:Uncharacterized protein n=2 Tax=Aliidongia dinghuensis TaxID=1867774 RepID=A0A8J2YZN0_9PROT|nr:hypothetical protein GCM10011611_54570 [Aliidongia dinghuensis]